MENLDYIAEKSLFDIRRHILREILKGNANAQ